MFFIFIISVTLNEFGYTSHMIELRLLKDIFINVRHSDIDVFGKYTYISKRKKNLYLKWFQDNEKIEIVCL